MKKVLGFDLTSCSSSELGELVLSFPENWGCLEGRLQAPKKASFPVAARTKLRIQNRELAPRLIGIESERDLQVLAIYAKHASPAEIEFRRAGDQMYSGELDLSIALELASHYAGLGYNGYLKLSLRDGRATEPLSGLGRKETRRPDSEILIHLGFWSDGEENLQSPRLEIRFGPTHPAEDPSVTEVLSLCRRLPRIVTDIVPA